jgi:hypothetical protein
MENIRPFDFCHYNNVTGYTFIKDVSLSIGEKEIDKHDGRFMDISNELNQYQGERGLDYLINRTPTTKEMIFVPSATKLYIPLNFWFCKDISQSIPLIALQFHEVKLKVGFRGIKHIINSKYVSPGEGEEDLEDTVIGDDKQEPKKPTIKLWANYIHLDVDERKKFAQEHHEYLIEQVQHVEKTYKQYIDIHLNHPVKCLYWVIQNNIAIKSKGDYK